ncbi:MAG: FecR domain-containing protein [bacterium]|nr:FecR domain-containing protein [bacterium]
MICTRISTLLLVAGLAMQALPATSVELACDGDPSEVVAQVVAKSGSVHAQRAGEDPRALSCNDVVHACETILTSPASRVGVLTDNVYAQVDTGSRLQIGADGDSRGLILHEGGLRVIDARGEDAAALQVTTPHLAAQTLRSDTEFWVSGAGSTRLCNHSESVQVTGHGAADPLGVATGCAVGGGQGVSATDHAEPSISVENTPSCEVEIAGLFTPTDVAAPQFGGSVFPDVGAPDKFRRDACEASNCPNRVTPTPPVTPRRPRRPNQFRVVDPPVGTGCGGNGFGCGGNP